MIKSKLNDDFKKLILEMEKTKENKVEADWLEKLHRLTGHKTVGEMINRFKKLAGIE